MIIMSKFKKRLTKPRNDLQTALVLGQGFGYLIEILELFKTVFVIADSRPIIKSKNLVYRENFNNLEVLSDISIIFVDLYCLDQLNNLISVWNKCSPEIIIEGDDVVKLEAVNVLRSHSYQPVAQEGIFHVWNKKT
jgi:hypothetical protein